MKAFLYVVRLVSDWFNRAACLFVVLTMALVVANVLLRAVFNAPVLGTYEFVGFLSVLAISMSLAKCALSHSHIAVDFLVSRLSVKAAFRTRMSVKAVSAAGILLLSLRLSGYALDAFVNGQVSPTSQVPIYPFAAASALGLLLLSFAVVHQMAELAGCKRRA
jgi:TRAP-type C4-dicarboxylate transport system permease small subunit